MQYGPGLGDVIAAGADDGRIHVICAQTGEKLLCPLKVDNFVSSIAYSPDGSKLAAAHYKTVSIFNMETNEVLCTVRGHTDFVTSVCFSSDGKELTSGSDDSTVRNWDPATRASLS